MNVQQFLTSDVGTRLWMSLGRSLPPGVARAMINTAVGVLAQRRASRIYRTVYYNQAHVLGPSATFPQLDANVRGVLAHGAQTSYDLMRALAGGAAVARDALDFTARTWEHINEALAARRGVVVCGSHLSAFNLGMLSFSLRGIPVQILSRPQPAGGFKLMTELRDRGLLEETPIDASSLRSAIRRLREGGVVGTAVDWPEAADPDVQLPFFGAPARLPTGHIRLALSTNSVLLPVSGRWTPEQGYFCISEPPMELERTGDRQQDLVHNALRVLAIIERWIAQTPEQWLMYYPVWPGDAEARGEAK